MSNNQHTTPNVIIQAGTKIEDKSPMADEKGKYLNRKCVKPCADGFHLILLQSL